MGTWGFSHLLAVVCHPALNVDVQTLFQDPAFHPFGSIPGIGMVGSYHRPIVDFVFDEPPYSLPQWLRRFTMSKTPKLPRHRQHVSSPVGLCVLATLNYVTMISVMSGSTVDLN